MIELAKKFYRCEVCGDIHYGGNPPETCPTCNTENAYHEIDEDEAAEQMGL